MLVDHDLEQIKAQGQSEREISTQLACFEKPAFHLTLARPCTVGDGIRTVSQSQHEVYLKLHAGAASAGRFLKFVPASGAASRMFQVLAQYYRYGESLYLPEISQAAHKGDLPARSLLTFCQQLEDFAFFNDLHRVMQGAGLDIYALKEKGRFREVLHYLLTEAGLNYLSLPKGLLKFHAYGSASRTPVEEHLVEAALHVRDLKGRCRLHFTILPEHEERFRALVRQKAPSLGELFACSFQVDFSFQSRATDTIVVDLDNRPFRGEDGRLLFWPGGHGALLDNLNSLQGDLVYIKNIDNVVPDRLKEPTVLWKKIIGGFLVSLQDQVYGYVHRLISGEADRHLLEEIRSFAATQLLLVLPDGFAALPPGRQQEILIKRLNRPIRVCGVVKNEGEPGGAPFWVKELDGSLSLQIVETAQVDFDAPGQQEIWAASTHFNPVDLVVGLRDFQGRPFKLGEFMNPDAVFISRKSKKGKYFKVLERPGLWNGAMHHWLTVFLEVPLITFNPVKSVLDLLRPEHQPE
jgi:hypothetical protein